ncbi:glutamine amidotransferase [Enhydrobacter aerosaccus]|uniref:Glutamine amidotransferase n=2 Tax=Enhydrobacter aerosaccus TaxID=225324 RepID=A0A1T4SB71_9HYPH|nr:glutamine amidotransferase [Enhydrobacter aerosaccus]
MCELFCLSSCLPTRATFSLKAFAAHGAPGGRNVDGWGLAFHDGRDVRLYKEPEPATDSSWLGFIQGRHLPTRILISHIRHALGGGVTLANTQPFVRELGGRAHAFAHNGFLNGIQGEVGRSSARFRPVGETDSEMAFCLLLERFSRLWENGSTPALPLRLAVLAKFAEDMRALGPANFLYSDGDFIFGHGHRRTQANGTIEPPGLWCLQRECAVDPGAMASAGVNVEPGGETQRIALLASVPLSSERWCPLGEGEIVVLADGRVISSGLPSSRSQTHMAGITSTMSAVDDPMLTPPA